MMVTVMTAIVVRLDWQVILMFQDMEKTLGVSEILKQGIKLFIYTTLACHIGACFLHVIACFHSEYDSVD